MLIPHVWLVAIRRDLVQRSRDSVMFWVISPRALILYNQGLDTTKQQQKQTYRLRNVRAGYVLYRALV